MAGGGEQPPPGIELKGIEKYFNSWTDSGRARTAKLTYAVCAAVGLYLYLKPKKPKAEAEPKK